MVMNEWKRFHVPLFPVRYLGIGTFATVVRVAKEYPENETHEAIPCGAICFIFENKLSTAAVHARNVALSGGTSLGERETLQEPRKTSFHRLSLSNCRIIAANKR